MRERAVIGTAVSVSSLVLIKKKPMGLPSSPTIRTRFPSPLRLPPGVIRPFTSPVTTSVTLVMVGNPSDTWPTMTLILSSSSFNMARGEQRSVTLLRLGSNLAPGPINEPSTPNELLARPNSTVAALNNSIFACSSRSL